MEYTEEKIESAAKGLEERKKTVYLIGDSITMGYRAVVKDVMSDVANVVYPAENGRSSQFVIVCLRGWSGLFDPESVGVVQFNTGHWDIAHWNDEEISLTSVEEYGKNTVRIYDTLRRMYPNAVIVYATTTRMNPNGSNSVNFRSTAEIEQYNAEAKRVLAGKDVVINDLFAYTCDFPVQDYADYCHYKAATNERIGRRCAELYASLLKKKS